MVESLTVLSTQPCSYNTHTHTSTTLPYGGLYVHMYVFLIYKTRSQSLYNASGVATNWGMYNVVLLHVPHATLFSCCSRAAIFVVIIVFRGCVVFPIKTHVSFIVARMCMCVCVCACVCMRACVLLNVTAIKFKGTALFTRFACKIIKSFCMDFNKKKICRKFLCANCLRIKYFTKINVCWKIFKKKTLKRFYIINSLSLSLSD